MEGKLNAGDAKCPFFCAHTSHTVICEGLIPDSRACLTFSGKEGKRIQFEAFCCMRYENCERYRALTERYKEETEV